MHFQIQIPILTDINNIYLIFFSNLLNYLVSNGIGALVGTLLCWLALRYILKLEFTYGILYRPIFISALILNLSDLFPPKYTSEPKTLIIPRIIVLIIALAIPFIVTSLCLKWRLKLDYKKISILTLFYYAEWFVLGIIVITSYYIYFHHYGLPFKYQWLGAKLAIQI
jgi:hypothetical protein